MAVIVVSHEFTSDEIFDRLCLWVIPVTMTNNQKKFTFNFLLDTGAQRSLIVPSVQKFLKISNTGESQVGSGVSGNTSYSEGEVDNLEIASIALGNVNILIGNLPQPFTTYKIYGLLGADILKMLCVTIDYPEKKLVIEKTVVLP